MTAPSLMLMSTLFSFYISITCHAILYLFICLSSPDSELGRKQNKTKLWTCLKALVVFPKLQDERTSHSYTYTAGSPAQRIEFNLFACLSQLQYHDTERDTLRSDFVDQLPVPSFNSCVTCGQVFTSVYRAVIKV